MLKKFLFFIVSSMMLFAGYSCAIQSSIPDLTRKETYITNVYYMEVPAGIVQAVECEDGHVAYLKQKTFSVDDIGSPYVYFYPADVDSTMSPKSFVECDILSITEEGSELLSKLLVTYADNTTEYYDLYLPGYMYEDISTTGQINLTKKEFYQVLNYNIRYDKIES